MGIPAALSRDRLTVADRQKIKLKKENSEQKTTALRVLSEVHNPKVYISPGADK